jgi:hypothetical protein
LLRILALLGENDNAISRPKLSHFDAKIPWDSKPLAQITTGLGKAHA